MSMSNYLDEPFGGADTKKFAVGGIDELYLIPKNKLGVLTTTKDAFGAVTAVTGIVPATGATFQEIGFKEENASYTDAYKFGNNKFMTQGLNFIVEAAGADAIEKAHQIILERKLTALVKRKNGLYYLLGHDLGLYCTDSKADSGAKIDDATTLEFTLTGASRGFAPVVTMDAVSIEAVITRAA